MPKKLFLELCGPRIAAVEKVNKNMYHISSIKSENQEVFWTFHVVVMQIKGKEMYKKVCCNWTPIVFLTVLVKAIQRPFSVKYLFGEAIFA